MLGAMERTGKLPQNPVALKTIVTTEMARAVAESYGAACYDTFTGFKFIAEKLLQRANPLAVFLNVGVPPGGVRALGQDVYLDHAVTASLLLTEMAAYYYAKGMTVLDAYQALCEKHGFYGTF